MKYSDNPIIEGRYDGYGRKTYWAMGYKGKGVKFAVIDAFNEPHGFKMASHMPKFAPEVEFVKLDMRGDYYTEIEKIIEAIALKVNIISISRSVDFDTQPMHDAIIKARSAGILIFCSAGNTGEKYHDYVDIKRYPAAYPETVSVLALDNTFVASSFSSHGSTGTITGFGQNILVYNKDGSEQLVNGTSTTTIDCALTAALHWCRYLAENGKHPTVDYMLDFISNNVVDMGALGKDNMTGLGFFTLDKCEYERVMLMMLDYDKNGMSDRVDRIKALVDSGVDYDIANLQVNQDYYIVSYKLLNGVPVPIYGGRKPM